MKQRILRHGIDGIGDCFKTCVVNILNLPYEDVPHFAEFEEKWWDETQLWAMENGYRARAFLPNNDLVIPDRLLVIGTGKSPRGNYNHSVIMNSKLELVFDPHPSNVGIESLIDVIVIEKV